MPFAPDPLSVRYERAAGSFLGEALAAPGRWHYRAIPRPGATGAAGDWLRERGIVLDATDAGGLTAWERAYQRALYRVAKQMGVSAPGGAWSLQREWGPVTAHGRLLGIRLSTATAARRAVRRKPAAQRYTQNPSIRSGGEGSPHQRFG